MREPLTTLRFEVLELFDGGGEVYTKKIVGRIERNTAPNDLYVEFGARTIAYNSVNCQPTENYVSLMPTEIMSAIGDIVEKMECSDLKTKDLQIRGRSFRVDKIFQLAKDGDELKDKLLSNLKQASSP